MKKLLLLLLLFGFNANAEKWEYLEMSYSADKSLHIEGTWRTINIKDIIKFKPLNDNPLMKHVGSWDIGSIVSSRKLAKNHMAVFNYLGGLGYEISYIQEVKGRGPKWMFKRKL